MRGSELIAEALDRVNSLVHRSVEGATSEILCKMPSPHSNSIAWLVWHLTRVQDHHISDLAGLPQLWTGGSWHERFAMSPDDRDTGTGHTLEQVAAFAPSDYQDLLGYHDAVFERSKAFLRGLGDSDLDAEIDEPQYSPLPTIGVRLVSIVSDNTQHAGQAAYLRGYLEQTRWGRA